MFLRLVEGSHDQGVPALPSRCLKQLLTCIFTGRSISGLGTLSPPPPHAFTVGQRHNRPVFINQLPFRHNSILVHKILKQTTSPDYLLQTISNCSDPPILPYYHHLITISVSHHLTSWRKTLARSSQRYPSSRPFFRVIHAKTAILTFVPLVGGASGQECQWWLQPLRRSSGQV